MSLAGRTVPRLLSTSSSGVTSPLKSCVRYNSSVRVPYNKIGVPLRPYVPLSWKNLPSPVSSPILFLKCLTRRVVLLGINTLQIVEFRRNNKPNFLLWKNEAIEQYVKVNRAFAKKNVAQIRASSNSFVAKALENRLKALPKDVELDWKLLKFNKVPKIISFNNFPNEDGSTMCLQIVYKFNTKQRLVSVRNGDVKSQDKDLTEYVVFNVDPYTDAVCLAGLAFESNPTDPAYNREAKQTQQEVFESMDTHGDIYRSDPRLAIEAAKKTN